MSKIRIEWLSDDTDCETCGSNWAEGAKVYLNEELILDLTPVAHCFGGNNYDERTVFTKLLEHLGYEVINE